VCNDLAEAMKALDGKKADAQISPRTDDEHNLPAHEDHWQEH